MSVWMSKLINKMMKKQEPVNSEPEKVVKKPRKQRVKKVVEEQVLVEPTPVAKKERRELPPKVRGKVAAARKGLKR